MNESERAEANRFITEYIKRKQAQGEWDPTPIGLMRIAYGGACEAKNMVIDKLVVALEQIADLGKRDHREPDLYTELGCVMNIAQVALYEFQK